MSGVESESPENTVFSASLLFDATSLLSASDSIHNVVVEITVNNCKLCVIILLYCWHNIAVIFSFLFYSRSVTTARADPSAGAPADPSAEEFAPAPDGNSGGNAEPKLFFSLSQ